jgi:hypothetical protein
LTARLQYDPRSDFDSCICPPPNKDTHQPEKSFLQDTITL